MADLLRTKHFRRTGGGGAGALRGRRPVGAANLGDLHGIVERRADLRTLILARGQIGQHRRTGYTVNIALMVPSLALISNHDASEAIGPAEMLAFCMMSSKEMSSKEMLASTLTIFEISFGLAAGTLTGLKLFGCASSDIAL